jgi:hypothetical protein
MLPVELHVQIFMKQLHCVNFTAKLTKSQENQETCALYFVIFAFKQKNQ